MAINPVMDAIIMASIIITLIFVLIRLRNKTLALWNEVMRLELTFHNKLIESLHVFLNHADQFAHHDHDGNFDILEQYKSQEIRALTLKDRQTIYKAIHTLFLCIDETSNPSQQTLKTQYEALQQCRLRYNSKVLYYNQFIGKFPMRLMALKMRFKHKEYFG